MTDQGPDQSELSRLERAAYARGASVEDVQRLVDYRAARDVKTADAEPERPVDHGIESELRVPVDSHDEAKVPPRSRRSALVLLGIGALVGALVTSGVTWGAVAIGRSDRDAGSTAIPTPNATGPLTPETEDSLAIFTRPDLDPGQTETSQRAALALGLLQPDTRTIGMFSEGAEDGAVAASAPTMIFVGRGESESGYLVCLFTDQPGTYSCVSAADFARKGLALRVNNMLWQWGPIGGIDISILYEPASDALP
jgi:hypothetical protein